MQKTSAILAISLALAGCKNETEASCRSKLYQMIKDNSYVGMGVKRAEANLSMYATIIEIEKNPDLNVCDYTILNWQLVKIN